jgi:hypothetical protein
MIWVVILPFVIILLASTLLAIDLGLDDNLPPSIERRGKLLDVREKQQVTKDLPENFTTPWHLFLAIVLDGEDERKVTLVERMCLDGLHHIYKRDAGAEGMPMCHDGVCTAVPYIDLYTSAASAQNLLVLSTRRNSIYLITF